MLRRLFFAIPAENIRQALLDCQQQMEDHLIRKPVSADNFHLTLRFLGSTPDDALPSLKNIAASIESPAFQMTLTQWGYFQKARCAWVGPAQIQPELSNLISQFNLKLKDGGWPVDSHFQPHITLFRPSQNLPENLKNPNITLSVDEFRLYESISTSHGVIYQTLDVWKLQRIIKD